MNGRPDPSEYNDYYQGYVDEVPDGNIIDVLGRQKERFLELIDAVPVERIDFRYAEGKWTVREVIGHVIDCEWIFVYRALRMARADQTPLAGMDQDAFMAGANFGERPLDSLRREFEHLRSASIELFAGFDDSIFARLGTASGFPFSVRALVHIIAGHAEHHMSVLEERYLR